MAATSIWAVKGWLGSVIIYTEDPDKTTNPGIFEQDEISNDDLQGLSDVITYAKRDDATFRQQLVTGVNCCADTAREEMMAVKAHYGKSDGTVAYHGYQSFRPGEATPDQAHEIGIKLAERLWGERFQVVVATHVDKEHIHSHFVVNSVSFADGKKYHRTKADYFQMRAASDDLCREYGLSVIEPQHEQKKSQQNRTHQTWRQAIKADVDEAIAQSCNYDNLVNTLTIAGYEVEWKYELRIRPVSRNNFIHVHKILGEHYNSDSILYRLANNSKNYLSIPRTQYYRPTAESAVITTMMRLAADSILEALKLICYLLTLHSHAKQHNQQIHPAIRGEVKKLENYISQVRLLEKYKVHTPEQLVDLQTELESQIIKLEGQRKPLYRMATNAANTADKKETKPEIDSITSKLKLIRADLKVCKKVAEQRLPNTRILLENTARDSRRDERRIR